MPLRHAILLSALLAIAGPAPAQDSDAHASRISDRILAALIEANGVPGMGASVWRDGRIVWTGSAGLRDVERRLPVDENTRFRFASVSKIFAVAAAARLRQDGRLNVDEPVATVIPYLRNEWPPISARQLAAHVSGLPHYQDVDQDRGVRRFENVRDAVALFSGRALLVPPGTAYSYSSWGYTLLSATVEEAAGRPYLAYLAETIVPGLPIGPDATASGDPDASRAYEVAGDDVTEAAPHDYSYSWGGAGLGGSPRALPEFGGRLLSGRVVSRETLEWMQQPVRLNDGSPAGEDGYQIGFGLRVQRDEDGERLAHHAGVTLGARGVLLLYPDRNTAVSVLSNALWVSSIERTARTLSAPFRPVPAGLVARGCPTALTRYRGMFGDQPVEGTASFRIEDGVCIGDIAAGGAFANWLNAPAQRDVDTVRLIGMDANGGFSRAALVTPLGAYELRADAEPGVHGSRLTETRALSLRFEE